MNYRWFVCFSATLMLLAAAPKTWTPPSTADGQPDLQGIWTNATLTPLERPADLANKEILTEQEAAEFAKRALKDVDGDRRDGGSTTDVNRAYNEFWRDRGKVLPDRRTSLIVDTPDGRIPPLTPEAKQRAAARADARRLHPFDGPEDRSLAERCIAAPNAGPPMMPANYNANYQIVQAPGYVTIVSEQIHDARVIPLDGRPHLPAKVQQWMGDSRGHWEGSTLVVETTNFTDRTNFANSGAGLRLVERLTRTAPDVILYEFHVEDPATFTHPWTVQIPLNKAPGPLYEYACNEGNYGMTGMLAGARAEEKAH
ncbi:MAG TPA: hypothetical protein VLY24_20765 [Bryobacteraceae bacterium]|nr:hypothetical protein [Bryobacteraceae bacterium]